ncbi:MAG: helix-turn-helix domain-containing protein [Actinomycetota bacterium]
MHDTIPTDEGAPVLDEDGLLRVGARWVAIPDAQIPVVKLLVERFGRVVRRDALVGAYVGAGHSGNEASVRSLLARVARRIEPVGLTLHTIRGRGVILSQQQSDVVRGDAP